MTNAHTPTEKSKNHHDNIKNATKITQRLRTDLGRSVGVTAVTPLVWLNGFYGRQPSYSPQRQCNQTNMARKKYCLQYKQTFIKIDMYL